MEKSIPEVTKPTEREHVVPAANLLRKKITFLLHFLRDVKWNEAEAEGQYSPIQNKTKLIYTVVNGMQ